MSKPLFRCILWWLALAGNPLHGAAQQVYALPGHWVDDRAQAFALASLNGHDTVLTMAYGACRRICSTSLRVMQQAQALADQRHAELNFVVVSLDPKEDRPGDWAAFRAEHGLQRANWTFLTGDDASTRALAARLGVRYWRYDNHTMHDYKIVRLDARGHVTHSLNSFDDDPAGLLP